MIQKGNGMVFDRKERPGLWESAKPILSKKGGLKIPKAFTEWVDGCEGKFEMGKANLLMQIPDTSGAKAERNG